MPNMDIWTARWSYEEQEQSTVGFETPRDDENFQRDRARVIHSSSFRRLQSKTQVLGLGDSDFYRTRLTHSMEAAQIGSGICEALSKKYNNSEYKIWIPSFYLIEAICLLHDIGHPPFGHGGEVALNYSMAFDGGFEGNGQTLRIASKLGEYSKKQGFDLTRRTLLGILKYPCSYSEVANEDYFKNLNRNNRINIDSWKPPKCIFDSENDILEWILIPFSCDDKNEFKKAKYKKKKHESDNMIEDKDSHKISQYKSFDTSIMEIADDIAYGVHDLEDALKLRLISRDDWEEISSSIAQINEYKHTEQAWNALLFAEKNNDRKPGISRLVRYFIQSAKIVEKNNFEHSLLKYQAIMKSPEREILKQLKGFVSKQVIKRPEVQTLEYKGQQMVVKLFEVLDENPKRLLPKSTCEKYEAASDKRRVICDYISGMTDIYAKRVYHRLFNPDIGSIFDVL